MPLVNGIIYFLNLALLSSLWYLLLKLVVYVSKKPLWVEYMPSLNCVNSKAFASHTPLVFCQIKFQTLQLLRKWEVNERLCIGEVGVNLELCVHAHGPDVKLIMEASRENNYPLGISSSYFWGLVFCNRGSDHIFSLIPFLGQVKALVFCKSIHQSNLYLDLPSSITL